VPTPSFPTRGGGGGGGGEGEGEGEGGGRIPETTGRRIPFRTREGVGIEPEESDDRKEAVEGDPWTGPIDEGRPRRVKAMGPVGNEHSSRSTEGREDEERRGRTDRASTLAWMVQGQTSGTDRTWDPSRSKRLIRRSRMNQYPEKDGFQVQAVSLPLAHSRAR